MDEETREYHDGQFKSNYRDEHKTYYRACVDAVSSNVSKAFLAGGSAAIYYSTGSDYAAAKADYRCYDFLRSRGVCRKRKKSSR